MNLPNLMIQKTKNETHALPRKGVGQATNARRPGPLGGGVQGEKTEKEDNAHEEQAATRPPRSGEGAAPPQPAWGGGLQVPREAN